MHKSKNEIIKWNLHGIDLKSFKLFSLPWKVAGSENNENELILFNFTLSTLSSRSVTF